MIARKSIISCYLTASGRIIRQIHGWPEENSVGDECLPVSVSHGYDWGPGRAPGPGYARFGFSVKAHSFVAFRYGLLRLTFLAPVADRLDLRLRDVEIA